MPGPGGPLDWRIARKTGPHDAVKAGLPVCGRSGHIVRTSRMWQSARSGSADFCSCCYVFERPDGRRHAGHGLASDYDADCRPARAMNCAQPSGARNWLLERKVPLSFLNGDPRCLFCDLNGDFRIKRSILSFLFIIDLFIPNKKVDSDSENE